MRRLSSVYIFSFALLLTTLLAGCGAAPASSVADTPAPSEQPTTAQPGQSTAAPAPEATSAPDDEGSTSEAVATVRLGEPFGLKVGQQARFEQLGLRFLEVREDSRCPRGVECVWEGQIQVALEIARDGQEPKVIELTLLGSGRATDTAMAAIGERSVQLVGVEPYPESGKTISPDAYVATFVVK